MSSVPDVLLNSGYRMPQVGLGTWKSKEGEVGQAVEACLEEGYRHVDCAHVYGNEPEIGQALEKKLQDGTISRDKLFVVSKLWNTFHRRGAVRKGCETTLKNLRLDYLDLYLMHWPVPHKECDEVFARDENGVVIIDDSIDFVDTWKGMEDLVDAGLVKSIGVSNFNSKQLQRILESCRIPPAVIQIESHPFLDNDRLVGFCQDEGIQVTAFSPFASPDRAWANPDDPHVFKNETIKNMAERMGKSVAQIALRFLVQRNIIVIPKSVSRERLAQNLKIFDFKLSTEDMQTLRNLNQNYRACPGKVWNHSKYFPFNEEF